MRDISRRGHIARWASFLPAFAIASAGLVATTFASGPAATQSAKAEPQGITVNGHLITKVLFDGRLISVATFERVARPNAVRAGLNPGLILDQAAIKRGYYFASTDAAAVDRYLILNHEAGHAGNGSNAALGNKMRLAALASQRGSVQTIGSHTISLAACSGTPYFAYMYANYSCGGSYLSMINSDAIPDFRTYGFNDVASSVQVGCKISNFKGYKDINYGGGYDLIHAYAIVTDMLTWNDTFSSATTDSSYAC